MTCEHLRCSHVAFDEYNVIIFLKTIHVEGLWPPNVEMKPQIKRRQLDKWARNNVIVIICAYEWWRGLTVILSKFVNISRCLCFRLSSHLICPYRPLLVNRLFFLLCTSCISVFFPRFLLIFSPRASASIFSAHSSVLTFVPWPSCITQHKLLRAARPTRRSPPSLCRHVTLS